MAHTCGCQMACGDTVGHMDWLHVIRLQMQLAHRPAAMSLYLAVSLLSPARARALTSSSGMTTLPFPAPLLPLLPAGIMCPPLHVPRSPAVLVEMTAMSTAHKYVQNVSADTGIILISHTQWCFYVDQRAAGALVWKMHMHLGEGTVLGEPGIGNPRAVPHIALCRNIWGEGSHKQPVQTKQGFGDTQIPCISFSLPLPHLKRPCLPLQKPCLLRLPTFHRVNWPRPYQGKSHPGCQPRAVLSRLQELPGRH